MDLLSLAGLLVGIWGGWIGWRSRRKQLMVYCVSSSRIITDRINSIPDLKITVGGELISDLTLTRIDFSNQGNVNIGSSDFPTKAHLRITSTGRFFNLETLNKDSISSDNPYLNPEIEVIDKCTLKLSFEYLEPKQSFSISLLHDGEISVLGKLKSGKLKQRQNNPAPEEKNTWNKVDLCLFFILTAFIFFAFGTCYSGPVKTISHDEQSIQNTSISASEYAEMQSRLMKIQVKLEALKIQDHMDRGDWYEMLSLNAEYDRIIEYLALHPVEPSQPVDLSQ